MPQQISMERALDAARRRIGELTWENVLLAARVEELEAQQPAQPAPPQPVAPEQGQQLRQGMPAPGPPPSDS